MQSRNKIAYLGALTLLFSYAEMLFPRITPFFKLGLSNAVIIYALTIDFPSFLVLCLIKAAASSLTAGTLFSPFFLVSVVQSVVSGVLMFGMKKIFREKIFSAYGLSMLGAAVSALAQIFLCSLYLGSGTMKLLGPMLIFSLFSGILTAFIYEQFSNDFDFGCSSAENRPCGAENDGLPGTSGSSPASASLKKSSAAKIALIAVFSVLIFMSGNIIFLSFAMILSFVLQKISKRRILILPHLFLWIFVFLSQAFVPGGKILFRLWKFSVTDTALLIALAKSLKLSAVMALSQCIASVQIPQNTLLGKALGIFSAMSAKMHGDELKGLSLVEKIRSVVRGG